MRADKTYTLFGYCVLEERILHAIACAWSDIDWTQIMQLERVKPALTGAGTGVAALAETCRIALTKEI